MIPLSRRTDAQLLFLTEPHVLRVHYSDRTLICPGPGCPMCPSESPRKRWYAMAEWQKQVDLAEIPPTLIGKVDHFVQVSDKDTAVGLAMSLRRNSKRSPWNVRGTRWLQREPQPVSILIEQTALLFRIELPSGIDTWEAFAKTAGQAHVVHLKRAVLPYMEGLPA